MCQLEKRYFIERKKGILMTEWMVTEEQKEEKPRRQDKSIKSPFSPKWSFVIRKM